MRTALLCNALVIVLDPLFIYGLDLGVQGAATANLIARAIALAVALTFLLRRTPHDSPARANRTDAVEIIRTGLPMSGDFLARALVGMLLVEVIGGFGVVALAGYGIGTKIMLAGVMAFYALRQATMIQTARSGEAGPALRYGLVAGLVVAAVLNAVAVPMAGLFTGDPVVVAEAVGFLRWMTLYLVPFGGLIALGGVLQANGRGGGLLAATLTGFAVQLPLTYLLGAALGVAGVWLAMAAGAALTLILAVGPRRSRGPASAPPKAARPLSLSLRAWRGRRGAGPRALPAEHLDRLEQRQADGRPVMATRTGACALPSLRPYSMPTSSSAVLSDSGLMSTVSRRAR